MKKLLFLLALVGMIFTACEGGLDNEEDGGNPSTPKIELSQQSVEVAFESAQHSVSVTSPYSWEAISKNEWIVVDTPNGIAGEEKLKFTTLRNEEEQERKGTITLKNTDYNLVAELYITQKAFVPNEMIIEPESLAFTFEGGTQEVAITANFEYEYSTNVDWLTIKKSEKGVNITATLNTEFEERTAEITISNKKYGVSKAITITQQCVSAETQNVIIYTSSSGFIEPYKSDSFDANIVSNTYRNGQGLIIFDAPVTSIGWSAFHNCDSLTSITIPNSVTSIGSSAFSNCDSLTSVTIGNSVTSIGYEAFYECSSLTSITIPNSVTSIGDEAFYNCDSLTSVTIPNSVTSIGKYAFRGCTSLTSVDISDLSAWCKISFSNYEANPLNKGAKLYLTKLYLNGSELTNITIPSDITEIKQYTFSGCTSLTSVTIPNRVTMIGRYAFYKCTSLTSVTIPDSVTSIGEYAFYGCTGELIINSKIVETNYTDDNYPANSNNGWLYGAKFTKVTIGNSVTKIGDYAFYKCKSLTSVTIPDSVTSIGESAFYNCTGELTVNCNIPSASSYGNGAFYGSKFTKVTIGDSVTSIGEGAFGGCTLLEAFYGKFASSDNRCLIIDGVLNAFAPAELTNYVIPNSVTSIGGYAFYYCDSLTSITIPDSVTSIGTGAFYGCAGELTVNCNIPSASVAGDGAFYCSKFTKVTIGDSVTSIGSAAFYQCTLLQSVTIPNSVTSIGGSAFYNCISLKSITIPDSVTSIGYKAFCECTSLKEVYCKATTPPTGGDYMFSYYSDYWGSGYRPIGCKIYVPRNSVEAYKAAQYWSDYASYIVGYDF